MDTLRCPIVGCKSKAIFKNKANMVAHVNSQHKPEILGNKLCQDSLRWVHGLQVASCCGQVVTTGRGLRTHKDQSGHQNMDPPVVLDNVFSESEHLSEAERSSDDNHQDGQQESPRKSNASSPLSNSSNTGISSAQEEPPVYGKGQPLRYLNRRVRNSFTDIIKELMLLIIRASREEDHEGEERYTEALFRAPEMLSKSSGVLSRPHRERIKEIGRLLTEDAAEEGVVMLMELVAAETKTWSRSVNESRDRRDRVNANQENDITPDRSRGEMRQKERKAVEKKVREGELSRAARIIEDLRNQDSIREANGGVLPIGDQLVIDDETLNALFPEGAEGAKLDTTIPPPVAHQFPTDNIDILFAALESGSKNIATANSAWSPELILEMLRCQPEEFGVALITLLNLLVAGKLTAREAWIYRRGFFLPKKDHTPGHPSLRAICIAEVFTNLAGRMMQMAEEEKILDVMEPQGQLGQGTEDGTGTVVATISMVFKAMEYDDNLRRSRIPAPAPDDLEDAPAREFNAEGLFTPLAEELVIGSFDIQKAYNNVNLNAARGKLLEHFPGMVHFFDWMYRDPTPIYNSKGEILAWRHTGVPTGDAMAALIYNLATLDVLKAIRVAGGESMAIIDDIYVVATISKMPGIINVMVQELTKVDLTLNRQKSQVICKNEDAAVHFQQMGIPTVQDGFFVLSVPVGCANFVDTESAKILRSQQKNLPFVRNFNKSTAWLLANMVAGQRPNYQLRSTSPKYTSASAKVFAEKNRAVLAELIDETCLSDFTSRVASLPTGMGGVGLKNAGEEADPAYVSSSIQALFNLKYRLEGMWEVLERHPADPIHGLFSEIKQIHDALPEDIRPGQLLLHEQFEYGVFPRRPTKLEQYRAKKRQTPEQQEQQHVNGLVRAAQENVRPQYLPKQRDYAKRRHAKVKRGLIDQLNFYGGEQNANENSRQNNKAKSAIFLSQCNARSGEFVNSALAKQEYLRLTDCAWKDGIRYRLLLGDFSTHQPVIAFNCPCCDTLAEEGGSHAHHSTVCRKGAGLHTLLHNLVVKILATYVKRANPTWTVDMQFRAGNSCGYLPNREVDIVIQKDNQIFYVDCSLVQPNTVKAIQAGSASEPLVAASLQEEVKNRHHAGVAGLPGDCSFLPFVLEATGTHGKRALQVLEWISGTRDQPDGRGPRRKITLDMVRLRNEFLRHVNAVCIRALSAKATAYRKRAGLVYIPPPQLLPQRPRTRRRPLPRGGSSGSRVGNRGVAGD